MNSKMLIDASHPEETRVVVVKGNRIEEFDFESDYKKQIKGNIYLAKVTRVEPSLQAAFVEYGGNRHGFLAFSEIHPDYYQIPIADRQALVEEDLARAKEEEEQEERKLLREHQVASEKAVPAKADDPGKRVSEPFEDADAAASAESTEENAPEFIGGETEAARPIDIPAVDEAPIVEITGVPVGDEENLVAEDGAAAGDEISETGSDEDAAPVSTRPSGRRGRHRRHRQRGNGAEDEVSSDDEEETVEELGSQDAMEEVPSRIARPPRKQYKIQEVIKRRQILLVQVVKEERGNKGAALTTYLSLAGRYSVLMPNTARGGGISRKITNIADRKRLKEVVRDLEVPRGMGIILRTAGAMRTKAEVKRDYEYLMRLWDNVRTLTLASSAPALVYEEGSLIKRSIRDLYNKDIDQILVSGDSGYREAKDFMRMLLPSQAKVVQPYREAGSIFSRGGIEAQLDRMLQPHVTLKSGGYIIINQTEALVSIDVNSGRSTREHSVEDTAVQTNLEAAEEIARQLRLRDLAGLIVVDFIDMDEKRNNRAVEKKMKDCLKEDRARIQVGHISHFGLLEMSRQRIRASVLESTTQVCPTCSGMGFVRSNSSLALHVIRAIEEHLQKQSTHDIIVKVPTATALYVLNEKRKSVDEIERLHGVHISIQGDDAHGHQHVAIEQGAEAAPRPMKAEVVNLVSVAPEEAEPETVAEIDADAPETDTDAENGDARSEDGGRRRRRRRRGGGRQGDAKSDLSADDAVSEDGPLEEVSPEQPAEMETSEETPSDDDAGDRKRRRRGRRGGRRSAKDEGAIEATGEDGGDISPVVEESPESLPLEALPEAIPVPADAVGVDPEAETIRSEESEAVSRLTDETVPDLAAEATAPVVAAEEAEAAPVVETGSADLLAEEEAPKAPALLEPLLTSNGGVNDDEEADKPKRTGWWARRSFF